MPDDGFLSVFPCASVADGLFVFSLNGNNHPCSSRIRKAQHAHHIRSADL
jgi:hypothetical protein